MYSSQHKRGFTLIELSIVLVIIGLIIGGVLVGQDLIKAAQARAQVTQMERLNTTVNTFVTKYGYLPGDIPAAAVTQFAFGVVPTRAGTKGQGDGNGILEGYGYSGSAVFDFVSSGETAWFWEDLTSNSGLMEGSFNYAGTAAYPVITTTSNPKVGSLLPNAKLGSGIYLYVYTINNINYFGLSAVYEINQNGNLYAVGGNPGITVSQAFAIDKKIDDGLPQSGTVTAAWEAWDVNGTYPVWAASGGVAGANPGTAATGSASTCFDNGGSTAAMQYSMEQNGGSYPNCGLSFKMQGAAR